MLLAGVSSRQASPHGFEQDPGDNGRGGGGFRVLVMLAIVTVVTV